MRPHLGRRRSGMGAMVVFIGWIVAVAIIYAFMQSEAQHGALGGVMRVTGLRTVVFAGQSALVEASYALRHPPDGVSRLLQNMKDGSTTGLAAEPLITRKIYESLVAGGVLDIQPVMYEVAHQPPSGAKNSNEPWEIDLIVRVTYSPPSGGIAKISRQIRRRYSGRICRVRETVGPHADKDPVVFTSLYLWGDPLLEVIEE